MEEGKTKKLGSVFGALILATSLCAEAATTKTKTQEQTRTKTTAQKRVPASKTSTKGQASKSATSKSSSSASAQLSGFRFEERDGTVEFLAIGNPGALRVKGVGKGPVGTVSTANKKLNVNLEVDLRTLKTGIDLRDSHMKEKYLQTGAHPKAKLVIKDFVLPNDSGEASFEVPGQLTLKGVTKSITFKVNAERSSNGAKFDSKFRIKLEDFGIEIPKYLGITMAENVDITVKAESNAIQ